MKFFSGCSRGTILVTGAASETQQCCVSTWGFICHPALRDSLVWCLRNRCIFAHVKITILVVTVLLYSSLPCAAGMQNSSPTPTPTPTRAAEETPKAPIKLRVSSGVAQGLLVRQVNPVYPREARKEHIQGDVLLQIVIDKQGNVTELRVSKGEPILAEAAVTAVKQWKYRPYLLNGEPVEIATTALIEFHM